MHTAYDQEPLVIMIDQHARIQFLTERVAHIRSMKVPEVLGLKVQDVFSDTRLHLILKSGIAERYDPWTSDSGVRFLVSRIPLFDKQKVVGVLGIAHSILPSDQEPSSYYSMLPYLSPLAKQVRDQLEQVAPFDTTVLLLGETGAGKEVFARALHEKSKRAKRAFIKLNCAAISESLAESELFGYAPGAFTGAAKSGHKGKFELANGGTLFLDEIGDLPLPQQAKLLRALQDGQVDRVGGERSQQVDVRVIAATNKDLVSMVKQGKFREDLYYRINVVQLRLPALRQQKQDIVPLAKHIWRELCERHHHFSQLDQSALHQLSQWAWPGNIRELKHTLERILVLTPEKVIHASDIQSFLEPVDYCALSNDDQASTTHNRKLTKSVLMRTLQQHQYNKSQTAKVLGISRALLYKKMKHWEITD